MAQKIKILPEQWKNISNGRLTVLLADTPDRITDCLRLRFDIFVRELGAKLENTAEGLDRDRFDDFCIHLMVIDNETRKPVATTRLLTDQKQLGAESFYSATEFDITNIINRPGRFMEVGRTCIHSDYRRGHALSMLWRGIGQLVALLKIDYLIGCASIPLSGGDQYLQSLIRRLRNDHYSEPHLRVKPLIPLPKQHLEPQADAIFPTLLRAYLKQGAVVCGEPYWDSAFGVADVFILLDCDRIANRYVRHFINRKTA